LFGSAVTLVKVDKKAIYATLFTCAKVKTNHHKEK